MRKIMKLLLMSCVVIGVVAGCETNSSNNNTSNSVQSSISDSSIENSALTSSINSSTSSVSSLTTSSSSIAPTITGIVLSTDNVKKEYEQNEALDLTGLVVTASYSDGSTSVISDYTVSPENNTVFTEIAEVTITISYLTFSESFKVSVTKATKKNWTEEESKLMSDHLHGVVLPYTGFEESVVSYKAEYDTLYIEGGNISNGVLDRYASAMVNAGFTRLNNDSYNFKKVISTDAGNRFVKVVFYADLDNLFYLEAYDPYLYDFPVEFVASIANQQFYSNQVVPSFSANYYETSKNDNAIYCYVEATEEDAGYTTILSAAGWDVSGGKDNSGEFFTAISPDRYYMIHYIYTAALKSLDIYLMPPQWWNSNLVASFYEKYSDYIPEIPALEIENATYVFWEATGNEEWYANGNFELIHAEMFIYGSTSNNLAPYAQTLRTAGWDVEASAGGGYQAKLTIPNLGIERIDFYYSTSKQCVIVTFYTKIEPLPGAWPAAEIAASLGSRVTDVLPPYEGTTTGCAFYSDSWGTFVLVQVETGTEDDALACYEQTLVNNGYTKKSVYYYSPHNQIKVYPTWVEYGSITINFSKNGK